MDSSTTFSGLVSHKTWKLYRVSPLYRFDPSENTFQAYSTDLHKHLKAEYQQSSEEVSTKIFSVRHDPDDDNDQPAVVIAVLLEKNGKTETSFQVILSRLASTAVVGEDFTSFSIALIRGLHSPLATPTLQWFQLRFDCTLSTMTIPSYDLARIAALLVAPDGYVTQKPLELTYSVPSSVTGIRHIMLNFDPNGIYSLYHSISKENRSTESNGELLLQALNKYFDAHFHINLTSLSLSRVGTGVAFLDTEGKVKIQSDPAKVLSQIIAQTTR